MNNMNALKQQSAEVTAHEKVLRDEKKELKVELRTSELSHQEHVKQLVGDHDRKVTDLCETFEARSEEIVSKFERKMKEERDILEL